MIEVEYYKNLSLDSIEYIDNEGNNCIERWMPVKGKECCYEISDLGRIKSVGRFIEYFKKWHECKIINQCIDKTTGYSTVNLGTSVTCKVHRLVGLHYIPNPLNKRTINHKKGNKLDNRYFMLEWNTHGENHKHAYDILGRVHNRTGKTGYQNKRSKEILCVTNGKKYGSISEAGRELKCPFQNISKVLHGERNNTNGFVFKFV